jgi:putative inorganic carbon (HCO3(-)) transporter
LPNAVASLPRILSGVIFPPLTIPARFRLPLFLTFILILGTLLASLPLQLAVFGVGGALVSVFVLRYPRFLLYFLPALIPFSPWFTISVGGARVGLMEATLLTVTILTMLRFSTRRYGGENPGDFAVHHTQRARCYFNLPILLWPFLLFLAVVSLSWLNALSLSASLVETIKWAEMLILYGLIIAVVPRQQLKWFVAVILLTGTAQASLGLYQFLFKVGPPGFLLFGGRFLRAYGSFAQPNPYAGYLGLILPLAMAVVLWAVSAGLSRQSSKLLIFRAAILVVPLLILLAALFASQSRSGWLGFMAAAVVVLLLYHQRTAVLVFIVGLLMTVFLLIGAFNLGVSHLDSGYGAVMQRLAQAADIFSITDVAAIEVTDANFATVERLAHWQVAREMWRDNPWLGVGFGNYAAVYPAYALGRWLDPLGHAHNYLLNIGAETGLVGISGYLIFWIFTFGVIWRAVRHTTGFNRTVVVGVAGALIHLHVHNLFDNLYVQGMYLHVAVLLAMASLAANEAR